MSLLQKTGFYQVQEENAVRKYPENRFILAAVGVAVVLVVASVMFTQAFVGGQVVGPYVGP